MKNKSSILWGLMFLFVAVGLILVSLFPNIAQALDIPFWKAAIGLFLLAWSVSQLLFGKSIRSKMDFLFPLALLYAMIRNEFTPTPALPGWVAIVAALLISIGIHLIFDEKEGKNDNDSDGSQERHHNSCKYSAVYLDADTKEEDYVENHIGKMEVFYQNTEIADPQRPLTLHVVNTVGDMIVHVPNHYRVVDHVDSALGGISYRANTDPNGRIFNVEGDVHLGTVKIVSP